MTKTNPTTIVVFGATGDLFRKKLAPALFDLFAASQLPEFFRVVAFSRRPWGDNELRQFLSDTLKENKSDLPPQELQKFLEHVLYIEGDLGTLSSYQKVAELLGRIDSDAGVCANKLFYLATPPAFYETILKHVSDSGLAIPCAPTKDGSETGWTRILVEKPFGNDLENAQRIDLLLGKLFSENQIFRIDHYLAKNVLRDILSFRFSEGIFEQFWNARYIEKVEVNIFERIGINGRGAFYDRLGQLRDMGQSHALAMAALVAMEGPKSFSGEPVRQERSVILAEFKLSAGSSVRAQYEGYENEPGVGKNSTTETYFKIQLSVASPRWRGVPFILESGKGLPESRAEIRVYFKKPFKVPLEKIGNCDTEEIIFQIQPEEKILIRCQSKTITEFSFGKEKENKKKITAYERVLLDAISGDQTLFTSTEEVKAEWQIIMPVLESWKTVPLIKYLKGTTPR